MEIIASSNTIRNEVSHLEQHIKVTAADAGFVLLLLPPGFASHYFRFKWLPENDKAATALRLMLGESGIRYPIIGGPFWGTQRIKTERWSMFINPRLRSQPFTSIIEVSGSILPYFGRAEGVLVAEALGVMANAL